MPKKKERLDWGGYLNFRLDEDQKKSFTQWRAEMGDDVWDLFLQVLAQGMKISLVYDPQTDTYIASLMNSPRCTCGVNSLYVLSGFAQHWYEAVAVVLFKHFQLLGGTWENYSPSKPIQDRLG